MDETTSSEQLSEKAPEVKDGETQNEKEHQESGASVELVTSQQQPVTESKSGQFYPELQIEGNKDGADPENVAEEEDGELFQGNLQPTAENEPQVCIW